MTLGLRLAFTNMDKILTSPIDETISAKNLKPRIAERARCGNCKFSKIKSL